MGYIFKKKYLLKSFFYLLLYLLLIFIYLFIYLFIVYAYIFLITENNSRNNRKPLAGNSFVCLTQTIYFHFIQVAIYHLITDLLNNCLKGIDVRNMPDSV